MSMVTDYIFSKTKALSTLSQKSETVSQKWDCRRKRRNSVTVSLLWDSLTFLRQYSRTFLRQRGQARVKGDTVTVKICYHRAFYPGPYKSIVPAKFPLTTHW